MYTKRTMLAKQYRFHGHGSLRYVYKNGEIVRSHLFTLKYSHNPRRRHSRFAVVVSKKVHKSAVGRNRIRRRMYELFRRHCQQLPPHDVVLIITSAEVRTIDAGKLEAQFLHVLENSTLPSSPQK